MEAEDRAATYLRRPIRRILSGKGAKIRCRRLLMKGKIRQVEIKCPKCGCVRTLSSVSSDREQRAIIEKLFNLQSVRRLQILELQIVDRNVIALNRT